MANLQIPFEERSLSPEAVEALDRRRRRGQLLLVIGLQAAVVTTLLTLWVGQDLTYSPGWNRIITYWAMITGTLSLLCLLSGIRLRRGFHEFTSY